VGPAGTYTFQATATQPILFNTVSGTWDLSSATYSVTVGAGSTIDVGGSMVGGACFSFSTATGTHNHIARASGTSIVDVTVVESGIPVGQQFVKVDKYQKTGGQSGAVVLTSSNANTVTAQVGGTNGGPTSLVGANVVFYNEPTPPPPSPSLDISKTADNGTVSAGTNIGFSITVSSNGPGTATAVTLNDPLPTGSGISWSIDSQPAGNPCSIVANVLTCAFGNMPAGTDATVHISSPTTTASCATYTNTASASATNHATVTATAATTVECQQGPLAGCTPGFWKQKQHFQFWTAPYAPNVLIQDVFASANGYTTSKGKAIGTSTLVEGLSFGGGSTVGDAAAILLRAAIAGLLNAASPDVNYFQSVANHISAVNAALASGNRDTMLGLAGSIDFENNRGCTAKD
ncbi:MAG TPA: DUF11 domain-containing protein, partial [Longimicrobiales bacterium]